MKRIPSTPLAAILLLGLLSGCAHAPPATAGAAASETAAPVAAPSASEAGAEGPLTWMADDYDGALARARAEDKPLFVDLWAPWCHTCISMQKYVFVDEGLAPVAGRFVWLKLDADKPENAKAVGMLKATAMPTFYVVSPVDGSVQARFSGSASVPQLRAFLEEGERGFLETKGGALDPASPLYHLREGDRAAAKGELEKADAEYAAALAAAPPDWPRRADVLVSRISAHYQARDFEGCVHLGLDHMADVARSRSASASDFTYYAVTCADHVDAPLAEQVRRAAAAKDGPIRTVLDDPKAALSADDRSDALAILREINVSLGRQDEARRLAEEQRVLADRAAHEAPDAFAAMLWNWPRSEVYVFLGREKELVPDLEQSVKDLPNEYDPPYRLAWVLLKLGDLDRAAEMASRAADLAYGPRQARVVDLLAQIQHARGDLAAERAARQREVAIYEALPQGQKRPEAESAARAALDALATPAPAKAD